VPGGLVLPALTRRRQLLRSPQLRARRSTPDAMDQRHTPGARMPRSSYMIQPGDGVSCTMLMVSNNLLGIAHSKKVDGMDKLLWIYILNDVALSSLYLPSHA
jgi:hypothetical protein